MHVRLVPNLISRQFVNVFYPVCDWIPGRLLIQDFGPNLIITGSMCASYVIVPVCRRRRPNLIFVDCLVLATDFPEDRVIRGKGNDGLKPINFHSLNDVII